MVHSFKILVKAVVEEQEGSASMAERGLPVMRLLAVVEVPTILEIPQFMVQETPPNQIQVVDHKVLYQEVQVELKHLP